MKQKQMPKLEKLVSVHGKDLLNKANRAERLFGVNPGDERPVLLKEIRGKASIGSKKGEFERLVLVEQKD